MKTYFKYYSYSELSQLSDETLIDIVSDGDIPKKTKDMAILTLECRGIK